RKEQAGSRACDLCKRRKTKCKLSYGPRSSSKGQQSQTPSVEEPAATERATECRAPSVEVISSAAPANEQLPFPSSERCMVVEDDRAAAGEYGMWRQPELLDLTLSTAAQHLESEGSNVEDF
ncbi:hypothetical protein DM02DRAFT_620871, partial [Periconia macrospinosa]